MIHYKVKVLTFDWDRDYYSEEWREYNFSTLDAAKDFYNLVVNLDYEKNLWGKSVSYINWAKTEDLACRFGIDDGGVFENALKLYKIKETELTGEGAEL